MQFLPSWLKNKYFLTGIGFVVWMFFFDSQDIITGYKLRKELSDLEKSRDYYVSENEATRKELDQIKSDPATIQKYGREKYRMKKDNEDLYIIP